ncbi:MAG: nucleotidyltransferase domain-containing protein [Desulfomonilaceae bacterium]
MRSQPTGSLDRITSVIIPICKRYAIIKAIVFGSFAVGDVSKRSDLDLMLIMQTDKRFLDRYDGIYKDITDVVEHRSVDLLIYTPAEFDNMQDEPFMRRVVKEGVVIYG